MREVLEYLLSKNILVKNPKTSEIVLGEYGYVHLGRNVPKGIKATTVVQKKEENLNLTKLALHIKAIFPPGVKSGNLYVRSPEKSIEYKLKQFKSRYSGYTDDQILKATRKYVESFGENYNYMRTAEYFILKDGTSTLAGWIDNMDEDQDTINQSKTRGDMV